MNSKTFRLFQFIPAALARPFVSLDFQSRFYSASISCVSKFLQILFFSNEENGSKNLYRKAGRFQIEDWHTAQTSPSNITRGFQNSCSVSSADFTAKDGSRKPSTPVIYFSVHSSYQLSQPLFTNKPRLHTNRTKWSCYMTAHFKNKNLTPWELSSQVKEGRQWRRLEERGKFKWKD